MRRVIIFLTAAVLLPGSIPGEWVHAVAAEFYVATDGEDANPGTDEQPFATVGKAQQAVRPLIAAGLTADVTVWIAEGTYRIAETLTFGPEDSGSAQFAVTYRAKPGHRVMLSGGRTIGGWRRGEGRLWMTTVPGVDEGWTFRNLFVDGRRAIRARTPNLDAEPNCLRLVDANLSDDQTRFTLTVESGVLGDWQNASDVEVMIAGNWEITRKRVQRIDVPVDQLLLAPPHQPGGDYIFPKTGRWYHIENARELLDQPGEWYLDRSTAELSYWPREGEEMAVAEVVAPVLRQLVVVTGTDDQPVRNLHFRGLRFQHTDWQLPEGGYMGAQACHYGYHPEPGELEYQEKWLHIPAAVYFREARGCSVRESVLARLGGSAIELADRCRGNAILGNRLFNVSANGVMVGGPRDTSGVPEHNEVSDNWIRACGIEYDGAVGIWIGFAQGTKVSHNLVHDLPYTGISIGWEWTTIPTSCRQNLVESNHVHDVMKRLCDGGGIYTLGLQPGTVIRRNHLHDVHRSSMAQGAPNDGMFLDNGSKGYLFEQNVIYNVSGQYVRFNDCQRDWHTWRDNHFGEAGEVQQLGAAVITNAGPRPPHRERWAEELPE